MKLKTLAFALSMAWVLPQFSFAETKLEESPVLSPLHEQMNRQLLNFIRLEKTAAQKVVDLRAQLLAEGGSSAVELATEYQYALFRELDDRYTEVRPSTEELNSIAAELSDLFDAVSTATSRDLAEFYLNKAMDIIVGDLDERYHSRNRILRTMRFEKLNQGKFEFTNDTTAKDSSILEYSLALAELELILDAAERLATMISSYQSGQGELAMRFQTPTKNVAERNIPSYIPPQLQ